jgi:RNA recognition motif-containing protein
MNIFVGNIALTASEDDLRELFEQHGMVDKVHLEARPREPRRDGRREEY